MPTTIPGIRARASAEADDCLGKAAESFRGRNASYRRMPVAVRRFVRKRDGNQCRFVNELGRRCPERRGLEFHHEDPFGKGSDHDPTRICLMCRRHNAYLAEREYGKEVTQKHRRKGDCVSETAPFYGAFDTGDFARRSGGFSAPGLAAFR